ncbi:MAG: hypothetical protein ACOC16_03205 [Nanoarchaeota archaeon]
MKINKISLLLLFLISILSINSIIGYQYNEKGDFSVDVETLKQTIINEEINNYKEFNIKIKNNLQYSQNFKLNINEKKGWDISIDNKQFSLDHNEEKNITVIMKTNSEFNYETNVISPDIIKISQQENYIGTFEFPLTISGENQNVSLKFSLDIEKREIDEIYTAEFSTQKVSPQSPLNFAIKADNIKEEQNVNINLEIAGENYKYQDTFSKENNYKIYSQDIPTSINPGTYYSKITITLEKTQNELDWVWKNEKNIEVVPYSNIIVNEDSKITFFKDTYTIVVKNTGNIPENYQIEKNMSLLKRYLLSTNLDSYTKSGNTLIFDIHLEKGETKTIKYTHNYIPLYLIIITIIVILIYIYIRKNSNPLDVETKIYEIKKVKHEGVKSMKIQIGFENIKEHEIENLRLIFRMPSYLNVKDNSFLLREPNHVLKGKNQYKLIWDFKRFEQNDSRIIGFSLVNNRGVLGDIKIPDLEIETKTKGKIKKYYQSFPIIKG